MERKPNKPVSRATLTVTIATIACIGVLLVVFFSLKTLSGNPTLEFPHKEEIQKITNQNNIIRVTIPEGFTVTEVAEKLEENGVCKKDDFLNEVNNPSEDLLTQLGIFNKDDRIFILEGYVFPDTYDFFKGENSNSVLMKFVNNYLSKITEEDKKRASELGYTIDEILRIASIIQEESGRPEQDGKVSSVLHNRLKTGTKIECDVTISYLTYRCQPYLQNGLTEKNKSDYNTYKCPALPAGPITNPGYASIKAALYPDDTTYMFFVTDKDWNYYYATTWDEHVANCKKAEIPGY